MDDDLVLGVVVVVLQMIASNKVFTVAIGARHILLYCTPSIYFETEGV